MGKLTKIFFDLLKNYKFKVAFGQHSGAINETSNLYYLSRFALNERYGEIDRVKFAASIKGLGVYDFIPTNPQIFLKILHILVFRYWINYLQKILNVLFLIAMDKLKSELFKFNERIEIRLLRKLNKGRSRLNCTAKDKNNNWRWFGHQFFL